MRKDKAALVLVLFSLMFLNACSLFREKEQATYSAVGGKQAVFSTDAVIRKSAPGGVVRSAALLGIYVSTYLSKTVRIPVSGALKGIQAQSRILVKKTSVTDPDYALLQAFADALQVDVSGLLNRSAHREQALNAYVEALSNVAYRANVRFKELLAILETLKQTERDQNNVKSQIDRDLKKAIDAKEFSLAAEKQKILAEREETLSLTQLKRKQTEEIIATLDRLLTLFSRRKMAIEQNREALIAGIKVVDMPGVEDLKLIEKRRTTQTSGRNRSDAFDNLFDFSTTFNGVVPSSSSAGDRTPASASGQHP